MLNEETKQKLKKMNYKDLENMFLLLFDEEEKKEIFINSFVLTCNNDYLIQKLSLL